MAAHPGHPRPGAEWGPCSDAGCKHRDCAATRADAETMCARCREPIGYGVAFYRIDVTPSERGLVHARCEHEAIDKR